MKKVIITAIIPITLALVLFMCGKKETEVESNVPVIDESAIAVRVTKVKTGDFIMPVVSSGLITTGSESKLSFKTSGIVTRILVEEGQQVKKGQLLATLDQTEIDAQLSQASNNFDKMKRDLERVERLHKDSAATLEQLQNVKTGYDMANEQWRIASFNKQYSTIHATTNGRVIRKFANEGELVTGGTPVLVVNSADENDWIVRVGLPDVDWVRVRKGDKASIKMDAWADQKFDGVVSLINEGSDPVSGLYVAEIKISPKGRKLATGLVATVNITPSEKQSLMSVPVESLIEGSGSKAFVFIAGDDNKSVKKISVRVAWLSGNDAVISDGLDSTDRVVTAGSAFLTEFSVITISEEPVANR